MTTKDLVLEELLSQGETGAFVSGEALAEKCMVSRAAIWKAIKTLEEKGYDIEAVTNRGYRLRSTDDVFSKETILSYLPENFSVNLDFFDNIDSTNTECKRRCVEAGSLRTADGELTATGKKIHRLVIAAARQTAGRGRLGRSFYSPDKSGVYISLVYAPEKGIVQPARMTVSAAVAITRAITKLYGKESRIKWVNDIFTDGKKVSGILTEGMTNFETASVEAAVIGMGINLSDGKEGFPPEIRDVAGSISGKPKSEISRSQMTAEVILELLKILDGGEKEFARVMEEYKARSNLIGKTVKVNPVAGEEKSSFDAQVIDIDEEACLVVKNSEGKELHLSSGEVTISSRALAE